MKLLGVPQKIWVVFYFFACSIMCLEGYIYEILNDLTFLILFHTIFVLPPFLFYFFKKIDFEQRKKIAGILFLFLLAICGYELYLDEYFTALSLKEYWPTVKFRIQTGVLFFVVYCLLLTCKLPALFIRLFNSLVLGIFLLPLIFYCSFSLTQFLTVAILVWRKTGQIENIVFDPVISHTLLMTSLKVLFVLAGSFCSLLPFPVIRLSTTTRKFLLWLLLPLALNYLFLYMEKIPYLPFSDNKLLYSNVAATRENPLLKGNYSITDRNQKGLYFLIVGESHDYDRSFALSKIHNSYFRKVQKDKDYIVFHQTESIGGRDMCTSGYCGASQYNLCHMLSNATEKQDVWYLYTNPDLLDVMKMCKIKTLWYTNLGAYRNYADILLTFAARCDYQYITDNLTIDKKYADLGFQIDNEIPVKIQKLYDENIINKDRSFMVIKPLGPHNKQMIMPEAFNQKYKKLPDHDRAFLYYEDILERIFATLKSFPETQAILYVSDHSFNHNKDDKIVMFVWLSKNLQKQRPELKAKLEDMAMKPYCHIKMYYLFLDIMNISVSKKASYHKDL